MWPRRDHARPRAARSRSAERITTIERRRRAAEQQEATDARVRYQGRRRDRCRNEAQLLSSPLDDPPDPVNASTGGSPAVTGTARD
jgi:hypothetical protein